MYSMREAESIVVDKTEKVVEKKVIPNPVSTLEKCYQKMSVVLEGDKLKEYWHHKEDAEKADFIDCGETHNFPADAWKVVVK